MAFHKHCLMMNHKYALFLDRAHPRKPGTLSEKSSQIDSLFCLFFNSVAWYYSRFTFALYLGFDFFIGVSFYPELCFFLLSALNLLLHYPHFIFPIKVSEVTPQKLPCEALHIFFKSQNAVSQNFTKIWVWATFSLIILGSPWACSVLKLIILL